MRLIHPVIYSFSLSTCIPGHTLGLETGLERLRRVDKYTIGYLVLSIPSLHLIMYKRERERERERESVQAGSVQYYVNTEQPLLPQ